MNLFSAYSTLGVHPGNTDEEIKARHRALSREHHPDLGRGNPAMFIEVQEAFRMIKGPEARKLLATRLKGLGEECPDCGGRGYRRKQKGFGTVLKSACETCGSCGYIPR